jgi:hypothetical protein
VTLRGKNKPVPVRLELRIRSAFGDTLASYIYDAELRPGGPGASVFVRQPGATPADDRIATCNVTLAPDALEREARAQEHRDLLSEGYE